MALAIATNNAALRAAASASSVNRDMETSMARLSSGKRINSASDDAAGVAISSRLTSNIRGTDQAIRNALDGQALIDTAEGAHKEIENILQRMREVAVQAANDTNNAQDRANLQAEMDALSEEINRIAGTTTWAGTKMLDAESSDFSFHIGAGVSEKDQVKVSIGSMTSSALGLGGSTSSSSSSSTAAKGFVINGVSAGDLSGYSVSDAGDVNGDGLSDLIIGAREDNPNGSRSGASTVVFGKADGTAVELSAIESSLNSDGFVINGGSDGDFSGFSVSGAGDVNGDGLADLIVSSFGADPNGSVSGASTVVFGKADGSAVELSAIGSSSNSSGFVINGVSATDRSGYSVSGAGDVNGDGLDDLIIGAYSDDPNGSESGASTVVFGKADGSAVELSAIGSNTNSGGFVINGISAEDYSGHSVSGAGDVNGDGLDDLLVGAYTDDPNAVGSGASTVIFGKANGTAVELSAIESSSNSGGFVINGVSAHDRSGYSVSGAGDVNGDGLADLIVGAPHDDPNGDKSGASTVVFGKADGTAVELSAIASSTNAGGFVINGVSNGDLSGQSVNGAGDVNGDGLADLIVGAPQDDPNGDKSGASTVVFGKADGTAVELSAIASSSNAGGFVINGVSAEDESGFTVSGAGDVNGDGLADLIVGTPFDDPNGTDSGASFVVFGKSDGTAVELSDIEAESSSSASTSTITTPQKVGSEFQVNTYTVGDQGIYYEGSPGHNDPSVTSLANGGYAIAWTSDGQDGSGHGVFCQIYDANNLKVADEFQLSTHTGLNQGMVSLSGFADGKFIAVWDSYNQDGSKSGVYGQILNTDGSKSGGEFYIPTNSNDAQYTPNVGVLNDGNALGSGLID